MSRPDRVCKGAKRRFSASFSFLFFLNQPVFWKAFWISRRESVIEIENLHSGVRGGFLFSTALSRSRHSSLCSVRCRGSHSPPQSRCLSSVLSVFLFGVLRPTQLYFFVHKLLHFIDNTVVNKNHSLWAPFFSVWFDLHSLIKLLFGCFLF